VIYIKFSYDKISSSTSNTIYKHHQPSTEISSSLYCISSISQLSWILLPTQTNQPIQPTNQSIQPINQPTYPISLTTNQPTNLLDCSTLALTPLHSLSLASRLVERWLDKNRMNEWMDKYRCVDNWIDGWINENKVREKRSPSITLIIYHHKSTSSSSISQ